MDYLAHYGIKDMKWYHRRYQNSDGSLTPLGRIHYGVGKARSAYKDAKEGYREHKKKKIESKIEDKKAKSEYKSEMKALKKDLSDAGKTDEKKKSEHVSISKIHSMDDKELQNRINRLRNEATLADLEASKNLSPTMRAAKEKIIKAGSDALYDVVKSKAMQVGKDFLGLDKKSLDKYEMAARESKFLANLKGIEANQASVANSMYKRGMNSVEIGEILGMNYSEVEKLIEKPKIVMPDDKN